MTGSQPRFGWIYWCRHVFTDGTGVKARPCVVVNSKKSLADRPNEIIMLPLTSKLRHGDSPGTVTIHDHEAAGLDKASVIKPVPFTVALSVLESPIGELDDRTKKALDKVVRQLLGGS